MIAPAAPAVVLGFETRVLGCGCCVEVPRAGRGVRLTAPCAAVRDAYTTARCEIPRGWLLDGENAATLMDALDLIASHVDAGMGRRR